MGAVTGFSSSSVGLSEKYGGFKAFNGTMALAGIPFPYLLRDILEFDADLSAALSRIYGAARTCPIYIGLGDSRVNQLRVIGYSESTADVYSDATFPESAAHPHPRYTGVVYVDKREQPSSNPCLSNLIALMYGTLDAYAMMNVSAVHATGTTHVAIYDYALNYMYIASVSSAKQKPIVPAFLRPYYLLQMNTLWAEEKPNFPRSCKSFNYGVY